MSCAKRQIPTKPRVGVSSCLLGEEVRYDGGHKKNLRIVEQLGDLFEWVPVCPEVEVGMETPREPVNLHVDGEQVRMIGAESGEDWTERMAAYATSRAEQLAALEIDGYILKARSPSCGLAGVEIHAADGTTVHRGVGLFASALGSRLLDLPMIDEDGLADPALRDEFISRVRDYTATRSRD